MLFSLNKCDIIIHLPVSHESHVEKCLSKHEFVTSFTEKYKLYEVHLDAHLGTVRIKTLNILGTLHETHLAPVGLPRLIFFFADLKI